MTDPHVIDIPTAKVFRPLLEPARYKAAFGGRGAGKSHFFAELMIEESLIQPGLRSVCIREVQNSLKESVKRLLEDKIAAFEWSRYFQVMEREIRTPGDGLIIFQGMQNHTAESIKSLEGYDRAWVEEAQVLSERSLRLLRPTLRRPGSQLWFSWNPNEPTDPVDAFLRSDTPPPNSIVVRSSWRDNPWLSPELIAEREHDYATDPDAALHIWDGEYWQRSDAQVLAGKWKVLEFKPEKGWDGPYHGADWGFARDPTTLIRFWIRPDGWLMIEHEAYGVGVDLLDTPAMFDAAVPDVKDYMIRADDARPETISHMRRQGYRIEGAPKWKGSVEDGIAWLRGRPGIGIHARCQHTIAEARHWRYKTDRLTGDVLPALVDGNDHCWDAVRYGAAPLIQSKIANILDFGTTPGIGAHHIEPGL